MSTNSVNVKQLRLDLFAQLRKEHPRMCRKWFEDIDVLGISNGSIVIYLEEDVQLNYLERKCKNQFVETAQIITGHLLGVHFVNTRELDFQVTPPQPFNPSGSVIADGAFGDMLISPDYSFDNFVVGPGNQLAHAAAIAVSQKKSSKIRFRFPQTDIADKFRLKGLHHIKLISKAIITVY